MAQYRHPGPTLAQVTAQAGLKRSTTHRFLRYLVEEGLLDYDAQTLTYSIGPLLFEFGLWNSPDYRTVISDEWLRSVARETGQTSYVLARSGSESVCVQMADGHAQVRVTAVSVGQRRPLGVGAGGVALLSVFEEDEIRGLMQSIRPALRQFPGITPNSLLEDVLAAKRCGYAVSDGRVYPGAVGVGMVVPSEPRPWLAVSITAPKSHLDTQGIEQVVHKLRKAIEAP